MSIGFPGLSVQANKSVSAKIRKYNPVNQPIRFGLQADEIKFSCFEFNPETQKKINAETKRLEADLPPLSWIARLHTNNKDSALGKLIVESRKYFENTCKDRAIYNVTGNVEALSQYLPYRQKLQGKERDRYDEVVRKVLNQTQFAEADSNLKLYKALEYFQNNKGKEDKRFFLVRWFQNIVNYFKKRQLISKIKKDPDYRRNYGREVAKKLQNEGRNIDEQALSAFMKKHTRLYNPYSEGKFDKSSSYLFAAGVAELFHKRPEAIDEVLNAKIQGQDKPLKVIVAKNESQMGGQYRPGLNLIWLNQPALWVRAAKNQYNLGQHEFVHALSEKGNLEMLPASLMNEKQKDRFLDARKKLVDQYHKNDKSFLDIGLCLNGETETSSGLPYYAFMNDVEFLTVSLDTFKLNPEKLRLTEAGKDLYDLYKEIFKIDPIHDLRGEDSKPQLSLTA